MKKNKLKGFTLVELIVVIAIIGVLASILIPSMMGYIKGASLKSANANAKIIYNTVSSYTTKMQIDGKIVRQDLIVNPIDCSLDEDADANEVRIAIKKALSANGSGCGWAFLGFDNSNGNFRFARWTKNIDASRNAISAVGQYPDPPSNYETVIAFTNPDIVTEHD